MEREWKRGCRFWALGVSVWIFFSATTATYPFDPKEFAFVQAVEKVAPAVVSVEVVTTQYQSPVFLRSFQRLVAQGGTSGFIVSPEGYVVTLYTQVKGAKEIQVRLHDGRILPARLANYDRWNNLAIIQILGSGPFPAVTFGDSSAVQAGETVLALGYPLGETVAASVGVISSVRDYYMNWDYFVPKVIQTDARFYLYNLGGPLVNMRGEVLGINALAVEQSSIIPAELVREVQNLNIVFPSNDLRKYAFDLIAGRKIYHPWFGIITSPTTKLLRIFAGMPEEWIEQNAGIIVDTVDLKGPAAKRGLRAGDIILGAKFTRPSPAGQLVTEEILYKSPRDLALNIRQLGPNDKLKLQVLREAKKMEIEVYPFDRPDDAMVGSI